MVKIQKIDDREINLIEGEELIEGKEPSVTIDSNCTLYNTTEINRNWYTIIDNDYKAVKPYNYRGITSIFRNTERDYTSGEHGNPFDKKYIFAMGEEGEIEEDDMIKIVYAPDTPFYYSGVKITAPFRYQYYRNTSGQGGDYIDFYYCVWYLKINEVDINGNTTEYYPSVFPLAQDGMFNEYITNQAEEFKLSEYIFSEEAIEDGMTYYRRGYKKEALQSLTITLLGYELRKRRTEWSFPQQTENADVAETVVKPSSTGKEDTPYGMIKNLSLYGVVYDEDKQLQNIDGIERYSSINVPQMSVTEGELTFDIHDVSEDDVNNIKSKWLALYNDDNTLIGEYYAESYEQLSMNSFKIRGIDYWGYLNRLKTPLWVYKLRKDPTIGVPMVLGIPITPVRTETVTNVNITPEVGGTKSIGFSTPARNRKLSTKQGDDIYRNYGSIDDIASNLYNYALSDYKICIPMYNSTMYKDLPSNIETDSRKLTPDDIIGDAKITLTNRKSITLTFPAHYSSPTSETTEFTFIAPEKENMTYFEVFDAPIYDRNKPTEKNFISYFMTYNNRTMSIRTHRKSKIEESTYSFKLYPKIDTEERYKFDESGLTELEEVSINIPISNNLAVSRKDDRSTIYHTLSQVMGEAEVSVIARKDDTGNFIPFELGDFYEIPTAYKGTYVGMLTSITVNLDTDEADRVYKCKFAIFNKKGELE